jgi:dephospho-CoA kinase
MQCIELQDASDKAFAEVAQLSVVTGAMLPSGLRVPSDGHWFIQGTAAIKRLRLAFAGPMASGKSTMARTIGQMYGCRVKSFAAPVKEIATSVFGMTTKDRKLLQTIGMTGRAIHPNTWANKLIESLGQHDNVCVDDVRFPNECEILKEHGFLIVYLDVDESERVRRLHSEYGEHAQQHIDAANDISEHSMQQSNADMVWNQHDMNAIVSSNGRCLQAMILSSM